MPPNGRQLPLTLVSPAPRDAIDEARRRGLVVAESVTAEDLAAIGEISGLIAGLNRAMADASAVGITVVLNAHYSDVLPPARRRCILAGTMQRLAFDARL